MKIRHPLAAFTAAITLLALIFGWAAAQGVAPEQPDQPGQISSDLGTGFTYQGSLALGGQPVNGVCDFRFGLWDASSAGTQRGTTQELLEQPVAGGRFVANLTSAGRTANGEMDSVFDGAALWLEIAVRCPAGSGSYTTLSPRQALSAAPYAISLRPGADIFGSIMNDAILSVNNNYIPATQYESSYGLSGSGKTVGLFGSSDRVGGIGVQGINIEGTGVKGTGDPGVAGYGGVYGVYGYGPASISAGVFGESIIGTGVAGGSEDGTGGYFQSSAPCCSGAAVKAWNSSNGIGVWASTNGSNAGVYGQGGSIGVAGEATANGGIGVVGRLAAGVSSGLAGQFIGNVDVSGSVLAPVIGMQIDHPLDPANMYLNQAYVASAEMVNQYSGNVLTDASGFAVVRLPEYVQAINSDFRYNLTVIGQFAQAIIAQELQNGSFTIQTDKPNVKVSWQVTGVRSDAYAARYPVTVEESKPEALRGVYQNPELYAAAAQQAEGYDDRQKQQGSPAMPEILAGVE